MDDDKGTSLIILQTKKGEQVFTTLDIVKKEQTYEEASRSNQGLKSACKPHSKRERFFAGMGNAKDWTRFCNGILKRPLHVRLKGKLKRVIKSIVRRINP